MSGETETKAEAQPRQGPGGPAKAPGPGKVVFAQIEPTTRCNFICGFCSGRQMDQTDLDLADFDRLLESFPDIRHIELQGEGEPLLHKGFFEMARKARERGIHLSMITNGSLLSKQRVAAILDAGMAAVNVSIESPDERGFARIRGGRLDKVKAGIARLLAARDARGMQRPKVGLAITVLKDTIDLLPQVADLYHQLGMDGGATIQPLSRMEDYSAVYDADTAAQLLSPEDEERMLRLVQKTPAFRTMQSAVVHSGHFYPEMYRHFPTEHGCPWVKGGLYVDRHGGITTCCMIKDTAEYGLGKLGVTPPEAILAQRQAIDAALEAGKPPAQCVGCTYYLTPERREQRRRRREEQQRGRAAARPGTAPSGQGR